MKKIMKTVLAMGVLAATGLQVQAQVPEIRYQAVDALGGFPNEIHMGEAAGVARNSRNEIYVYTRTGNPTISLGTSRYVSHGGARIFRFNAQGQYQGEIGQNSYGTLYAQQVRIDRNDDVWAVDQMSGQVFRFDPQGRIIMVLSRKPEAMRLPQPATELRSGEGSEGESFQGPTDVTWDSQGNIYVADGIRNARIAKYDSEGRWVKNWGERGTGPGQFNVIQGIAIDANDNLYVADYGNRRIQVFNTNGDFQREMTGFGAPMAICITPGNDPRLYVSNSNPPNDLDVAGEIYQMTLDGRILGKFGKAGKNIGEFGTVNAIDCKVPNELLVGELGNWRVQRVTLQP